MVLAKDQIAHISTQPDWSLFNIPHSHASIDGPGQIEWKK